jgi:hypothetical protein
MKRFLLLAFILIFMISCDKQFDTKKTTQIDTNFDIASETLEVYDIRNDSLFFNSATIENFDEEGNSLTVFWIGKLKDTVLRFYRKYDENMDLIGAEYYEPGDTEPSRDTVYFNSDGQKVEASLNAENQITWKSITTEDRHGNPVLKTYENGQGEYRGLDSLYFDDQDRMIKGFYENSKGKRSAIRTYTYLKSDSLGNWTQREMYKNDTLKQKHKRILTYFED